MTPGFPLVNYAAFHNTFRLPLYFKLFYPSESVFIVYTPGQLTDLRLLQPPFALSQARAQILATSHGTPMYVKGRIKIYLFSHRPEIPCTSLSHLSHRSG